jgi:hypothetical protein
MTKCSPDTVFDGKEEADGAQMEDILSMPTFWDSMGFRKVRKLIYYP